MEVFALIGPSGTGKSHHALEVADRYSIDYIIDDGLLIKDQQVVAGISSKKEDNKVTAIKRALFSFPDHREAVKEAIRRHKPDKILVISTSEKMVGKIVERLEIPYPHTMIHIEDVASADDIAAAKEERNKKGKHVIPVSYIEVKKSFPGQLVGRIWFFRKNGDRRDKTIVRPPFSYFGKVSVKQRVIRDIVGYILRNMDNVTSHSCDISFESEHINVDVSVVVKYGIAIPFLASSIKRKIRGSIQYFTGLEVGLVNINVEGLAL